MNHYFKIVLFLFLCSTRGYGQNIGITLRDNFNNSFKVDYELYVLTDTNATIKFEDAIVSNQFKLHQQSIVPNLGFTSNNYWFKFIISNTQAPQNRVLEFAYPFFNQLDVYIPNVNGKYKKSVVGDHLPFAARTYKHKNFLFDFSQLQFQ